MGREPGRAGCSPSGRPGFMAVPRRGKGLISRGPESRGRAGLAPWPSPLPRACGEGAVPALPSAPGPAVPPPHLPLGVPRRRPPGRGAAVPPALPGLGAGGRGAGTGRTLPCGVSALRDVPGLRAAHGLRGAPCEIAECRGTGLCRAGSQRCWGWGRLPLFGGGSLVPHSLGPGRAHPTQPRGVLGWGCPGRSLRTCRGPARCLSSGGGGGRGGGGSGAGTALEAVRAGQLQRDVSPSRNLRLCPQQVGDTGICRAAGIDCSHKPPPLPRLSDSSLMPGKLRRSRREVLGEKQWRSVEEKGSAQREQPKLTRSRTYESSCKDTEEAAAGSQGPPSPSLTKQNSSYHRAFGELAEQDVLLGCFSCAWQREMPYHGRLYVSSRHICFHSNLLLKDIKAVVPVASISALKKTNTALLVPNAISIRTVKGEKFLFVSLRQREATYQLLRSVCKHLQGSGQSPRDSLSSEETLGKSQISSQSALEQSTPEPNSLPESLGRANAVLWAWGTALWSRINPQLSSLNIIIIIYLLLMVALLLSSGYIGLRIAELEQQLSFAGAEPHLNLSPQYKRT
ncbi:uncharacterized protein LOC129131234 isoform X2 [Agelaius phoeniceus]|uniref:uncharacterized protein LOC129131234 isoform X2 n=1 Tax=Agelaius phoeniceus TaxID=39638 RepID=UPI004054FF2A